MQEERHEDNADLSLSDRNWDWKNANFRYAKNRAQKQPGNCALLVSFYSLTTTGYIGSYAMDGLCMALHCVWTTNSFREALVKCANLRGDADSVCAVLGQMAGLLHNQS